MHRHTNRLIYVFLLLLLFSSCNKKKIELNCQLMYICDVYHTNVAANTEVRSRSIYKFRIINNEDDLRLPIYSYADTMVKSSIYAHVNGKKYKCFVKIPKDMIENNYTIEKNDTVFIEIELGNSILPIITKGKGYEEIASELEKFSFSYESSVVDFTNNDDIIPVLSFNRDSAFMVYLANREYTGSLSSYHIKSHMHSQFTRK